MAIATPEARFIRSINKLLPSDIYTEGMANPYRGGTPDRYYEGSRGFLWVEYKYTKDVPASWRISDHITSLQKRWIRRAQKNNIPIAVIAGFNKKGLILVKDMYWDTVMHRDQIKKYSLDKQSIAAFIIAHCGTKEASLKYEH